MEVALRTNADCYTDTSCRVYRDAACYAPTGWWTDYCRAWRAYEPGSGGASPAETGIALPPAVKTPTIDTTPGSPTYGQAMVDGHVIDTPEDVQRMINQQIAAQSSVWRAQTQTFFGNEAAAACAVKADECGMFTSLNAACTDCVFDPTKPAFLISAFIFVALLVAKPWK